MNVMKEFRIGTFAFNKTTAAHIQQFARSHINDFSLSFSDKGLEEAIPVALEMQANGIEVIMSSRGTAALLRENLKIPILSFSVTSLDILKAIKEASSYGNRIFFPSFRQKLQRLNIVENILNIKLVQGIYHDSKSLESIILRAMEEACHVCIGGGVTKKICERYDFNAVEITISEEEIYSTFENAKSVAQGNRDNKEMVQRYHQILESISEGIVAVDRHGKITSINRAARDAAHVPDVDVLGDLVTKYLPTSSILKVMQNKIPMYNRIEKIDNIQHLVNHIPILMDSEVIGAVTTFKDVAHAIKAENLLRRSLAKNLVAKYHIHDLVHDSPIMEKLIEKVKHFARTNSTILIMGETGTGKEIVAQSVHNLSLRNKMPFVSINCGSLPDQLIDSELFGYQSGAFTGAIKEGKPGLFEIAHTGTIFLDEISATPSNVQTSLLRVLEQREVRRLGANYLIPVDVRIISASNKDLTDEIRNGRFREDLFFRLNVLSITIPPLRERRADIPTLVNHFIRKVSNNYELPYLYIPSKTISILTQYRWPGNVRQLGNFLEQLVLLCKGEFKSDVFEYLHSELVGTQTRDQGDNPDMEINQLRRESKLGIQAYESKILRQALINCGFSKKEAAKELGVSRTTLWRKLKKSGIS